MMYTGILLVKYKGKKVQYFNIASTPTVFIPLRITLWE